MPRPTFSKKVNLGAKSALPPRRKKSARNKNKQRRNYRDLLKSAANETASAVIRNKISKRNLKRRRLSKDVVKSDSSSVRSPETDNPQLDDEKGSEGSRNAKKKKNRTKNSSESSEEERFLHAIESGKLEDIDDEFRKIKRKDPKLMTARQRAILERKTEKDNPNEPEPVQIDNSENKVTEKDEARMKKNQRRKQLADEKREHDKKKTMEKLLRKSESKSTKLTTKVKVKRTGPYIVYSNNLTSIEIKLPPGFEFPLKAQKSSEPSSVKKCGVVGCSNDKKYNCSKTGVPLCSLSCYKQNLLNRASEAKMSSVPSC